MAAARAFLITTINRPDDQLPRYGDAYEAGDWPAVVAYVCGLLVLALVLALVLRRTPPLAPSPG